MYIHIHSYTYTFIYNPHIHSYTLLISGSIDGDELYWLLRDLGHVCTREETMRIISVMDVSGDGNVDFVEFIRWWENAPFAVLLH